jgi:hypothetical protein
MKITFELNFPTLGRWILGLLLVWAALSKLANPQEFFTGLLSYRLPLGSGLIQAAAVVLPWLELLCGLLLLSKMMIGPAMVLTSLLFVAFTIAAGQAWLRGLEISCGCFSLQMIGFSDSSSFAQTLHSAWFAFLRTALLALVSFYLLRGQIRTDSVTAPQ